MWAYFQFNVCLRNKVLKHRTIKQFESFFHRIPFSSIQKSEKSRWGRVSIFIRKKLSDKIWKDLPESDEHKEILSLKMSNKNSSNILLSCCFKPPKGDSILRMHLKQIFKKSNAVKKPYYRIGYMVQLP